MDREQAFETLRAMSFEQCIEMWNESASDHYMRAYEIHETDNEDWWDWIQKEIGSGYWYMRYLLQSQSFNITDKYFFYDSEINEFISFCTKQEMLEIIGDDFFIDRIIEQKMTIVAYGREWEVIDGHILKEGDWFVGGFKDGDLYMNYLNGYMVLYTGERTLKANI